MKITQSKSIKKRQRELKKYYDNNYHNHESPNKKNDILALEEPKKRAQFLDSLFRRIFLSSLVLLFIILFGNELNLRKPLMTNMNMIKFVKLFNNSMGDLLPINTDIYAYKSNLYDYVEFDGEINHVTNESFDGVYILIPGIVTKITKEKGLYSVVIQGVDDYIYEYRGLTSFDHYLYQYINEDTILGLCEQTESDLYQFEVIISKDNRYYSYYENSEN